MKCFPSKKKALSYLLKVFFIGILFVQLKYGKHYQPETEEKIRIEILLNNKKQS